MITKEQDLKCFDDDLATLTEYQRIRFELAKAAILDIVEKYPGIGMMAVAYVCVEESEKIPFRPAGAKQ